MGIQRQRYGKGPFSVYFGDRVVGFGQFSANFRCPGTILSHSRPIYKVLGPGIGEFSPSFMGHGLDGMNGFWGSSGRFWAIFEQFQGSRGWFG